MAYSLESRAPWLDHRLAELAGTLPLSFKIHNGCGKQILKQALKPLLPSSILARTKMGFVVPLETWLRTTLRPTFMKSVLHPEMEQFINPQDVRRLWDEHQSGRRNHRTVLWNLLMLGLWRAKHASTSVPDASPIEKQFAC